ncbi:hypothetical protein DVH24_005422 [Malus domestica]|uniref:Uncharacterized protein n=1 Tax=Malus domestica TaxID=3750 RepID=A0A498KHK7_MALDO|nr:hypothetical protein DVH24_005422 [Malus domestica]
MWSRETGEGGRDSWLAEVKGFNLTRVRLNLTAIIIWYKGRTQCTRLLLYAGSGRGECRLALPPFMERLLPSLEPETYRSWAKALAIAPSATSIGAASTSAYRSETAGAELPWSSFLKSADILAHLCKAFPTTPSSSNSSTSSPSSSLVDSILAQSPSLSSSSTTNRRPRLTGLAFGTSSMSSSSNSFLITTQSESLSSSSCLISTQSESESSSS